MPYEVTCSVESCQVATVVDTVEEIFEFEEAHKEREGNGHRLDFVLVEE